MNERVKELRKTLNLTMEKFGEQLGVTRSAISNIENGNRNLTDQMLRAICREFCVNENWLRNGVGEMFAITQNDYIEKVSRRYNLDERDKVIISTYMSLEPEKRDLIKSYIFDMIKNHNNNGVEKAAAIDAEVEAYRKELEAEAKGKVKSSAQQELDVNEIG